MMIKKKALTIWKARFKRFFKSFKKISLILLELKVFLSYIISVSLYKILQKRKPENERVTDAKSVHGIRE